jgi:hypothetical protein
MVQTIGGNLYAISYESNPYVCHHNDVHRYNN